jgi:hypothetical protein
MSVLLQNCVIINAEKLGAHFAAHCQPEAEQQILSIKFRLEIIKLLLERRLLYACGDRRHQRARRFCQ